MAPLTATHDARIGIHEKVAIDAAIAEWTTRPGALLAILRAAQASNTHKYLSMNSLRYVAEHVEIPAAVVYSMATFYSLFNLEPQGDNVVCVCRGTACHTRGSRDLLAKLFLDLGLNGRQLHDAQEADKLSLTTADGRFTVRTVACFGQCALAPVVEVNHHILSHVNERTLKREIDALGRRNR